MAYIQKNNPIPKTGCGRRRISRMSSPMKGKISEPCKRAAKRKFKVWPSAYASGWGVRCTRNPKKFLK
tara:strand:- start:1309 stop:1512 length:204 start_codon:yes stop_codon:yes gene_type:complete